MSLHSKRISYLRESARHQSGRFASVNSTESARFPRRDFFVPPYPQDSQFMLAVGSVAHARAPLEQALLYSKNESNSTLRHMHPTDSQITQLNHVRQASMVSPPADRLTHRIKKQRLPQSSQWPHATADSPLIPSHTLYRRKDHHHPDHAKLSKPP